MGAMKNLSIKKNARNLRKNLTDAEQKLWQRLRKRQVFDYKFRRQAPLGHYIVDFVCHEAKLVVEIDGSQHKLEAQYDAKRSAWLKSEGFDVLRFWNNEVLCNIDGVVQKIAMNLEK